MSIDAAWWKGLDKAWKDVFRKNNDFTGEATPAILKKIEAATHVDACQSAITSFAPLAAMPNLINVQFSGCKGLTSPAGLPKTITHLTFHWMPMEDITWVDELPNLEKVYCDKALQTKVNRRIGANKKKRK
jgi:hypothetical protein